MLEQPPKQGVPYHLCLFHCAWEAVQEEPVLAGRGVQVVLNQLHHHLITHLQRSNRYVVRKDTLNLPTAAALVDRVGFLELSCAGPRVGLDNSCVSLPTQDIL